MEPDKNGAENLPAPYTTEFAVILNENARRVTRRVVRTARDLGPRISLYTSRTKEEAYQIFKELMDQGVRRIISGGGDGTFFHLVSLARRYVREKTEKLQEMGRQARDELSRITLPEFGILKLGTGNSFAPLLGLKKGLKPVRQLARGEDFDTQRVHVLEAEEQCFTFCGLGWDAQILNDYNWLKKRSQKSRIFARYMQSLMGYLTAITFRTIPRVVFARKKTHVTIRNLAGPVYRVHRDGSLKRLACGTGGVIYDGPCNVTGVATTPYYGYELKAFPYAMDKPGFMHVRIVKASVLELVSHAWPIWHGTYKSRNFIEFLAEKVHFSFSEDVPLQLGGDAEGYRKEIVVGVADFTVDLLDFGRPLGDRHAPHGALPPGDEAPRNSSESTPHAS